MSDQFASPEVTSDDKLWCALSYVFSPLIPIILLLMEDKKNRPFIKAHNAQALAAGIAVSVIVSVAATFTCGLSLFLWLVMFWWAYQAYQGKLITIPVITDFVKNQGWA